MREERRLWGHCGHQWSVVDPDLDQPEESNGGQGQVWGSTTLTAMKPHWLKALTSLAQHFIFQKRENASIGMGVT